ncbi:hypothetical protein PF005_g9748 [Phytophthora fragariae]|uniref:Uncharacterized protein n=1 Tax=Phytophthora fragariae TaxID=53985 RepID=A0A6A3T3B7_9STRA|nr:hypothetical protein PF003_g23703 [Phytophthora fragariae]KAE8945942.1 hypothetical protein PF009_g4422 [Phytophthora fragariae]KAE8996666.1 hypothetical protein PF011_g15803 [Phytophthora fragariae]KAE9083736.1 hypothetical protein PF006_g26628 [Phytophthora fragariae]KAE9095612.1 hypothetical protein PF010_g16643 [Phytophthora fragariae]
MEVSFKKKSRHPAAGRKRSRRPQEDAEDASDGAGDAADVEQIQRSIQELREDQRLRDQLLREELAAQKTQEQPAKKAADSAQYGLHDPKKDGGSTNQKLLSLLDGQFTGQSATTDKDQHEELLNQFIEEQLQKKRKTLTQVSANGDEALDAAAALRAAEDKLFELPDSLKPDVQSSSNGHEEAADGGMLMGNAGIAEVELPASYAERTEKATMKALEASKAGGVKRDAVGGLASSALPANFSVDFNRHRTDYVAEMKSLNKDEQRERGFRTVGKNQASDDRAVSRFRKFESRKLRR